MKERLIRNRQLRSKDGFHRCLLHADRLTDFIFFRIGKQKETARDLTQEVYLRALRVRSTLPDDAAQCYAWLCGTAKNVIREYFAHNRKAQHAYQTMVGRWREALRREWTHGSKGSDLVDDLRSAIAVVMSRLPLEYQDVLERKYVSRQSVDEMVTHFKKTEHAVESQWARARRAFQVEWKKEMNGESF